MMIDAAGDGYDALQQHHQKSSNSVVQQNVHQRKDAQMDTTPKKSNVRKQKHTTQLILISYIVRN